MLVMYVAPHAHFFIYIAIPLYLYSLSLVIIYLMSMQVNNNSNGIKGRGKVTTVPCVSFFKHDSFVIIQAVVG